MTNEWITPKNIGDTMSQATDYAMDLAKLRQKELIRDKRASKTQARQYVKRPTRIDDLGDECEHRENYAQYRRNRHAQLMHLDPAYKRDFVQRKWDKRTKRELRAQYAERVESNMCVDFVKGAR